MGSVKVTSIIVLASVLLRAIVSLQLYSGHETPPKYGDFEAQRHWQEITVNLPITEWYQNSTDNDLMYWGLDYPPLTAYHSWLMGHFARAIDGSYIELYTSRGITTSEHKLFMRLTVILADILLYIPAIFLAYKYIWKALIIFDSDGPKTVQRSRILKVLHLFVALCYPGQILIDNGHFQYNNISLGLTCLAVVALLCDHIYLAASFFVFALNYKQMELYHALPFFFYLLAKCFAGDATTAVRGFGGVVLRGIKRLVFLGVLVISLFAVIWLPWLGSLERLSQVVHRIFPVARGVFEDKVSNIWCVVNVFYKIK